MRTLCLHLLLACLGTWGLASAAHAQAHPTVALRELPDALRHQYQLSRPEMNSNSRCAAAYDSHSEQDRMSLRCSIYIKLGAEGARRAMQHCEEDREKKHIHAPCRIVQE